MGRLRVYLRRHWHRYAFGILFTIAASALAMVIPYLIGAAVNAVEAGHPERVGWLAAAMCATAAAAAATRWLSRFTIFNTGRDIEYEFRNDLFAHLTTLGPSFYERIKTGDLMSRMINDLTAVRMMIGMGVLAISDAPLRYALALGVMSSLNLRLTLASIAPYLVLFISMRFISRRLMERSLRVQEGLGDIGARVQESLAGIHVVKAYTLEDHDAAGFRELNDRYNRNGLALARVRGAMMPMIRGAASASAMIVLIYGGAMVMRGALTVGDLVAFMSYLAYLAWPTMSLGWMISLFQRGKAAMKRLGEILDAPPAWDLSGDGVRLNVAGAVEWDRVWFSYFADGDGAASDGKLPWALRNVSVRVAAGGKLAIVGRTGSGKSTLVKLLARMMEPTRGRILLDGRDIRELPVSALRRTVGLVPQEPLLFSDSLARNVAFGRPGAELAEIERAVRIAGLDGDVASLPHGLDTVVGERGMTLSGGQKQRVTIARLLAYDPAVVVLDDALSSVDTETERAVLQSHGESVRGPTTIVVSHRASTVRDADEIIVLDDGLIAERGTHAELMARRGIYAELFRRQLLEEELARY
jgi:ATP-binding cassette subfamily B protein